MDGVRDEWKNGSLGNGEEKEGRYSDEHLSPVQSIAPRRSDMRI